MNELLQKALNVANEHKALLIKAGSTLAGAVLGAVVSTLVLNSMEELELDATIDEGE